MSNYQRTAPPTATDADATDPPLLRNHSEIRTYKAARTGVTYPGIRVFYRRHPKADELPRDLAPLPLLVFIHGLGGSVAQFHPLLTSLSNSASCLAIDFPGCGRSQFAPTSWDAYTPDCLIDLAETIIDDYREEDQGVVLIGHSMGTAIAARIASKQGQHSLAPSTVMGVVAICPVAGPIPEQEARAFRRLLWLPGFIFDLWRTWDGWGGPESGSVKRFVGPGGDLEARQLQYRFNRQSRTPVFRRMAWGILPDYTEGKPHGGLWGNASWLELDVPLFMVGGEHDKVTPPEIVGQIEELFKKADTSPNRARDSSRPDPAMESVTGANTLGEAAAPVNPNDIVSDHPPRSIEEIDHGHFERKKPFVTSGEDSFEDPTTPRDHQEPECLSIIPPQPVHPRQVIKSAILPGGHALLYMPSTVRVLAGLVGDFMNEYITNRFSLGWQLQYLSREGKWDVKNLAKWKSVQPVSEPIGGIFRAMKTLREVDEEHCPRVFASKWGNEIKDIVDISHADPVYDPKSFGDTVKYHKFPTVSKIPPTDVEVAGFINLIDKIREDQKQRYATESNWSEKYVIGVHCHYGFNRTGYFLVCYLVERCGYSVQKAITTFAEARPNGIRHSHFLDRLYVRYSPLKE